jgi:hypothetical protein
MYQRQQTELNELKCIDSNTLEADSPIHEWRLSAHTADSSSLGNYGVSSVVADRLKSLLL